MRKGTDRSEPLTDHQVQRRLAIETIKHQNKT
ncbi:hypothetical protein BSNT_07993 [Bacillus subtilis subsp. natto BEST195]|nr:hypothetical protein BSNT_07993 [Bacillus subtilis subsp. natto BEST195]